MPNKESVAAQAALEKRPPPKVYGKVAEVISDREVILNRGSAHGVKEGMYFAIYNPDARRVTDPDTGEDLGPLREIVVTVVAVEVGQKMTLARTFRSKKVNIGGTGLGISAAIFSGFAEPNYVDRVETLVTSAEEDDEEDDDFERVVDRGDPFESADNFEVTDVRSVTVRGEG
ncbi:hypothetical protein [Clavibacter nebraskensis]|nr:hypothetical protein [Clavibacter nebraskensis]UKF27084.1 hypothetical protein FGQ65_01885 [Clavibacter nebraskensis]